MEHKIINSLQAKLSDAHSQLACFSVENKPLIEEPVSVQKFLEGAIKRAITSAKKYKTENPKAEVYVRYEEFPKALYEELLENPNLKKSLEALGFEFYITHNGEPKPMVKFVLRF